MISKSISSETTHCDIDNQRRQQLKQWLQDCRASTLALFEGCDRETFCRQAHPDFSPIGWHLGHIAFTESLWLLERCAGLPSVFPPEYRRLFAADGLPKTERAKLPTFAEICDYLDKVRKQVLDYLEIAPLEEQERLWRFILQHESQHSETITLVLELQRRDAKGIRGRETFLNHPSPITDSPMIEIPAGEFQQGNDSIDALDNERPSHRVYLNTYWIDRYPVTCGQYQVFIQAGGYQNPNWWSNEGWKWLQTNPVTQPLYWKNDSVWDNHPVCGVSWYEADAYARFVGKRLPTEAEWEKAASWNSKTGQCSTYPWGEPAPDIQPDFSRDVEKPTKDLTPQPPSLQGKGENSKPLSCKERGLERGFPHPVKSKDIQQCNHNNQFGQTTPVDAYPVGQSASGCYDMLGNVWEWTASWFDGYQGFISYPYTGYSQIYFDGQHRVLKGSSWATYPWAMRCSFRNWYYPSVREILAGFRCAK